MPHRTPQDKKKADYSFIKDSAQSIFGRDKQLSSVMIVIASFIGEKVCINLVISGFDFGEMFTYII